MANTSSAMLRSMFVRSTSKATASSRHGQQLDHIPDGGSEELILEYYPASADSSKYVHYQDNGADFAYEAGEYNLYRFRADKDGELSVSMEHEGYEHHYETLRVEVY